MKILALDLGKFKSVACTYDKGSGDHSILTIRTTPREVGELLQLTQPELVVFEVCGFAGWIHDLAVELGVGVQVANPNHEGWRWNHVKRKTDRDDALKLARLAAMNQVPTVYVPRRPVREWRSLIAYRHKLVGRQTAIHNSIRSMFTREGLGLPVRYRAWTAEGFRQMAREARALDSVSGEELWRGMLELQLRALQDVERLLEEAEARLQAIAKADQRVQRLQTSDLLGGGALLLGFDGMKGLGSKICTVRPHHRSADGIEGNAREELRIAQRLKDRPMEQREDIHDLCRSIVEREPKRVRPADGDLGDSKNQDSDSYYSSGAICSRGWAARARSQFR